MSPVRQKLITSLSLFRQSPVDALIKSGRYLSLLMPSLQAASIKKIVKGLPLILQIETTNVCNARCIFCAYPRMKRGKGVMNIFLFEKVVKDYVEMGGRAVSLTPIQGDPLLDPHLLQRIRILESNPKIRQISLTTNAISLDKYSDEDVYYLLETLDFLQVSMGGLDGQTYLTMYGVNQFVRVKRSIERLLELNDKVSKPTNIAFAFRTLDRSFEQKFEKELDAYRQKGVKIHNGWVYHNYAGMVERDNNPGLVFNEGPVKKNRVCALPCVHMAICWDGNITACGCADAEGRGLLIGHVERDSLSDVWADRIRAEILGSFEKGNLPEICRKCSAYQSDIVFATSAFKNVKPGESLPVDFFHEFWGA